MATITEIETSIDNNSLIKVKQYVKEYFAKKFNIAIQDIDGELQKIFNEVNGLDKIVQIIPTPIAPGATDPATANDGDLFFNTTDNWLKFYKSGTWHNMAHLSAIIDAYTKAEIDNKFAHVVDSRISNGMVGAINTISNKVDITTFNASQISQDAKISANEAKIATNTTKISTNTTKITTNETKIATNTTNISANEAKIATNTTNIGNKQDTLTKLVRITYDDGTHEDIKVG